jgi:uncharacterized membrane protein
METTNDYKLVPGFGNSFATGWRIMTDNFLRLFLVILILSIVAAPYRFFSFNFGPGHMHDGFGNWNWNWSDRDNMEHMFGLASLGIFAAFFAFIGILYAFLIAPIFRYGGNMIFVQATRKIKPDFEYLVKGFMENYLYIVLANLLVFALVILGLFALIIPGIIIGCRLVFVKYIIMDKKLDPIEAVELSWKLTRGHGWQIFFMGFVSVFILFFGLLLMVVGVFPAAIWISGSFAALYESVLREKEKPAVELAA